MTKEQIAWKYEDKGNRLKKKKKDMVDKKTKRGKGSKKDQISGTWEVECVSFRLGQRSSF